MKIRPCRSNPISFEVVRPFYNVAKAKGYEFLENYKIKKCYEPKINLREYTEIRIIADFVFKKDESITHIFSFAPPNYKTWLADIVLADLLFEEHKVKPYFFLLYYPCKNSWDFITLTEKLRNYLNPKLNNIQNIAPVIDLTKLDVQKTNLEELLKL